MGTIRSSRTHRVYLKYEYASKAPYMFQSDLSRQDYFQKVRVYTSRR